MELFAKKIEKQLASYQQELIETHYREVDNMYRQIRGWRHDYRNHIQTMKAYAAAQDWDAIRNYLDLLDTDLQTVDTVIKTGNPMTDAILNSKISLAKAKGIEVMADAHIPVRLKSSEIDLCCILGNLFDNAIEASMKLPEDKRLIRVYILPPGRKCRRREGCSAAPRVRDTASVLSASTPSWSGWTDTSAATARTVHSPLKYCFRRSESCNSSPGKSDSSPESTGDDFFCYAMCVR